MGLEIDNPRKGHRSRLEIVRDILVLLEESGNPGSRKTHIMYGANLSYKLLTRYMEDVSDAGLIEYDGKSYYMITKRGETFLELYEDYEKRLRTLKKHVVNLNNGKEELEKMLES